MQRLSLTAFMALSATLCFACEGTPKPAGGAATGTATTVSSGPAVSASQSANAPDKAAAPKVAKPKPYKFTEAQALGTLPEGVGIAVGQKAPEFELADAKGTKLSLKSMIAKGPVMLVFYRGGW